MKEEELVSELLQRLWDRLVPRGGSAKSAQGELIRCFGRIQRENYGMGYLNWEYDKHELNIAGYPEGYIPEDYDEREAFYPDFTKCRTTKEELDNASYYDVMLNWMKKWLKEHPLPEWSERDIHRLQSWLEELRPRIPVGVYNYETLKEWVEWDKKNRKSEKIDPYWEGEYDDIDKENYIDAQILWWVYRNSDLVDLEDNLLGESVLDVFEYISEWTSYSNIANKLLEALAINPGAPTDLQRHLSAWTKDEKVRCAVASNPNTSVVVLEQLSRDNEWVVRRALAENNNTPSAVLKHLARDADESVRSAVAKNNNTPIAVLEHLARDAEGFVRSAVATNNNTPVAVLEHLARDADQSVRITVYRNPNALPLVLERIAENDKEKGRVNAVSNYCSARIALLEHIPIAESRRVGTNVMNPAAEQSKQGGNQR